MNVQYKPHRLIITCEHGGNRIPAGFKPYFLGQEELLNSHLGYDPGALIMAKDLAAKFSAPLIYSTTSRLLVDLNRSLGHQSLFSPLVRGLPLTIRNHILDKYYFPFRKKAEHVIQQTVNSGIPVLHISSHSFTPELKGVIRNTDIGLLYDPGRVGEAALCARWFAALHGLNEAIPHLRVRRNYPYEGKSDGFTAYLRRRYPPELYMGIELELNQMITKKDKKTWKHLRDLICQSLIHCVNLDPVHG